MTLHPQLTSRAPGRWEKAAEVHKRALSQPTDFAGLHYPFVLRFAGDLLSGVLNPDRDDKLPGTLVSYTKYRCDPGPLASTLLCMHYFWYGILAAFGA